MDTKDGNSKGNQMKSEFSPEVYKILREQGIEILARTLIPGPDGKWESATHGYQISDKGWARVWDYETLVATAAFYGEKAVQA